VSRTLVIGVGNEHAGDDAAGLLVARRVRELAPELRVCEVAADVLGMMELWSAQDRVILVDAVASGEAPGTHHRWEPTRAPLPAEVCRGSTHALGIGQAIELARVLDRLPRALVLFGIEGRDFGAGRRISPELESVVDAVARRVVQEGGQDA
jgi:hydrogenase maturation protease